MDRTYRLCARVRASMGLALSLAGCGSTEAPTVVVPAAPASPEVVGPTAPPKRPAGRGYVREANGTVHRAGPIRCDATIPTAACRGDESHTMCKTNADCTEHPHGKCTTGEGQIGSYCACSYSCAGDSECGPEQVCVCGSALRGHEGISRCATARCKADAECESGVCGLSVYDNGCGTTVELACRGSNDTCRSDADCAGRGMACAHAGDRWSCQGASCAIGRPLTVDGVARTAPPSARRDWLRDLDVDAASLPHDLCAALASRWADVAAFEHASVGSFARFSLQLLALGAPPDLLADAQRAALDEIEHARIAYALAALYGGAPIGPAALVEAVAPIERDLVEIVRALVREGCVGETLGAVEAMDLAACAADPALARALHGIGEDEQRHAELAWRSLAWLVHTRGAPVVLAAEEALAEAERELAADPRGPAIEAPEHASPGGRALGALRRTALREVVRPLASAVLARGAETMSVDDGRAGMISSLGA